MIGYIYAPDQQFYYSLISLACFGFWASAYSFIYTKKSGWEHAAASIMLIIFTLTVFVGILGVGGDLPTNFKSAFGFWFLFAIVVYVCVKAIDRMIDNNIRMQQACKEKEFNKQMLRAQKRAELEGQNTQGKI